jgi:hypothetical protein
MNLIVQCMVIELDFGDKHKFDNFENYVTVKGVVVI